MPSSRKLVRLARASHGSAIMPCRQQDRRGEKRGPPTNTGQEWTSACVKNGTSERARFCVQIVLGCVLATKAKWTAAVTAHNFPVPMKAVLARLVPLTTAALLLPLATAHWDVGERRDGLSEWHHPHRKRCDSTLNLSHAMPPPAICICPVSSNQVSSPSRTRELTHIFRMAQIHVGACSVRVRLPRPERRACVHRRRLGAVNRRATQCHRRRTDGMRRECDNHLPHRAVHAERCRGTLGLLHRLPRRVLPPPPEHELLAEPEEFDVRVEAIEWVR